MANIATGLSESVFNIRRWLGVNEAQEGEASLKFGEAAVCRNFRVTGGGALQKRPGSKNVAGLMSNYNTVTDGSVTTLVTEHASSTASFRMYPRVTTDSVGRAVPDGSPVTVTAANAASYVGYYYSAFGQTYEFRGLEAPGRVKVSTNKMGYRGGEYIDQYNTVDVFFLMCDNVTWDGNTWHIIGPRVVSGQQLGNYFGKYTVMESESAPVTLFRRMASPPTYDDFRAEFKLPGIIATIDGYAPDSEGFWQIYYPWFSFDIMVTKYREAEFKWNFSPVRTVSNTAGTKVQGIWSGFVGGREVLCAACNGHLWELEQNDHGWSKVSCGLLDTDTTVHMFGFGEKLYILNGSSYLVWDGALLLPVTGYRPLVTVASPPAGGGTELERVNLLSSGRRARFSPDGTAKRFQLPERGIQSIDYAKSLVNGSAYSIASFDLSAGWVELSSAPAAGTDTVEIAWSARTNGSARVKAMRYSELYNGAQDTRVFLYGDGTNTVLYSGLDYDGIPRADYFPDMNEAAIGDGNTPVTALIRHYDRLLAFKLNSAWSLAYGTLTLEDGRVTPGFTVAPVNRDVGNCAPGQAVLVENRPRTLDGRSVIEWRSASGTITGDQRNAVRVSQRVEKSIREFDLTTARTFFDKITHEYYVIGEGGEALIHNLEADAWYTYTGFKAACMINYKDEVYYGTVDGYLRHFSGDYMSDEGEPIEAYLESGAMDLGRDFKRKYSPCLWVGIKPEKAGYLCISAETDRKSAFASYTVETTDDEAVPTMARVRLKAKKFTYYKFVFRSDRLDTTATVVSADLRVRETGYVR